MSKRPLMAEEAIAMLREGSASDSSDEEVVSRPLSEPLEPALQDSVFMEDSDLSEEGSELDQEPVQDPLEDPDHYQPGPSRQPPEPLLPRSTAPQPAPKRSRGRPRKTPVVPQPPPKRPPTPPSQILTEAEKKVVKARISANRKRYKELAGKEETDQIHQDMVSLLVEIEKDEHLDKGLWIWNDFENDKEYINEDILFTGGEEAGMSEAAQRAKTELDCFRLFFTTAVVDNLVKQSNLYAQQEGATEASSGWTHVGREDILAFFGVAMAMSLNPKGNIADYWTSDVIMAQPWFSSVMTGRRFKSISRYFHIADNTKAAKTPEGNLVDKVYKVRPLINSLLPTFRQHFKPNRELSIDEQVVGTKARCSFIQVMKDKPTKQGVKVWALCDAKVHYCLEFQIYTGGTGEQGLSFRVVNDLMCHYLGKGHHVYFDNFYTSPELLAHLISHNTLAAGTVRQNRVNMPGRLQTDVRKVEKGQSLFLQSHRMTACRWKDKRDVFCLSTVHGNTMKTITCRKAGGHGEEEQVQKPLVVCDYNSYMGGVDVYDQLLSYHPTARRYKRYWLKIFWRLFDMAVLNAVALWKLKNENLPTGYHKNFKKNLILQLVAHIQERNVPVQPTRVRVAARLQHYGDPIRYDILRRCTVCKDDNRKTKFGCAICGEGVRLHQNTGNGEKSCFVRYHTQANF